MINLWLNQTSVSVDVQVYDASDLPVTGLVAATFPTIRISGGAGLDTTDTLTDLTSLSAAHTPWGIKERGQGAYRFDAPNTLGGTSGTKLIRAYATGKNMIAVAVNVSTLTAVQVSSFSTLTVLNLYDAIADSLVGGVSLSPLTVENLVVAFDTNMNPDGLIANARKAGLLADRNPLALHTAAQQTLDNANQLAAIQSVPGLTWSYVGGSGRRLQDAVLGGGGSLFLAGDYSAAPTPAQLVEAINEDTTPGGLREDVAGLVEGAGDGMTPADFWSFGDRRLTDGVIVQSLRTQARQREIMQGDAYGGDDRTFAVMASDGGEWPASLTGRTWTLRMAKAARNGNTGTTTLTVAATVVQATGDSRSLTVSLTGTQTAALALGRHDYAVVGVDGQGDAWTVERGSVEVMARP